MRLGWWLRIVSVWVVSLALGCGLAGVGLLPTALGQAAKLPVIHTDHGPNSAAAQKQHYVVLVSLDGFRWDYAKKYGAVHLLALGKQGVWAPEGMLPSYPSLTFPNHYAIVTGLYPEHNGLVANSFLDEERLAAGKTEKYTYTDPDTNSDGSWYDGVPLWSLAEQQGMRTACLFWPGSEAEIAGERPSEYLHFDNKVDLNARVDQVVAWLKEPEATRPHFITLYYSEVDHAGHQYGPDAPETKAAVIQLDGLMGRLHKELDATGLPVDLVVISDHGMAKTVGPWVTLEDFVKSAGPVEPVGPVGPDGLAGVETDGALLYAKTEADRVRLYNQLKKASEKFQVYRRKDVPAGLHYNENAREGDPVVIPTGAYAIRAVGPGPDVLGADGKPKADAAPIAGNHGYDPHSMPEMKATFFAAGPDIVTGKTVAPFENVNLYPWIAHLLGLTAPKSDGSLNILSGTLRDHGDDNGEKPDPATKE